MKNETPIEIINKAIAGDYTFDAEKIANIGSMVVAQLIRKNIDYGSSVFNRPILRQDLSLRSSIEVRMSDKIARLQNLLQNKENMVDESIADTMADLAGYAILWLCNKNDS